MTEAWPVCRPPFKYAMHGLSCDGFCERKQRQLCRVQAMVHAPLLRNFYLSGGHPRSQCKHRLAKPCLSCELVCSAPLVHGHAAVHSASQSLACA